MLSGLAVYLHLGVANRPNTTKPLRPAAQSLSLISCKPKIMFYSKLLLLLSPVNLLFLVEWPQDVVKLAFIWFLVSFHLHSCVTRLQILLLLTLITSTTFMSFPFLSLIHPMRLCSFESHVCFSVFKTGHSGRLDAVWPLNLYMPGKSLLEELPGWGMTWKRGTHFS